jgi:GNAT superfamily N-acetyltransferase
MDVVLRTGQARDAGPCGEICYAAFRAIAERHNFPPDFPAPEVAVGLMSFMLGRPDIYSVVAERDGAVVGSNFLWENGPIAGVGPITVDPAAQDRQLGRQLMEKVLERAAERRFVGVRLVQAAYHGRSLSLYAKLGFVAREPLAVMQGTPIRCELSGYRVRPASAADVAACNRLHSRIHGFEREQDLQAAIAAGTARVVEHGGRISGYGTEIGFFGSAVGENNEALKALLAAAPAFPGPGFLLPTRNGDLFRWCLEQGLRVVQPMTLMSLGVYQEPAGAFLPSILF